MLDLNQKLNLKRIKKSCHLQTKTRKMIPNKSKIAQLLTIVNF
jgi:hypothetical protein